MAVYWQLELLNEHAADEDGLPTTIRFVFYELEQCGSAQKPKPDDVRRNVRRSKVWPPGSQDITDAITALREDGVVPWNWIADTERHLAVWSHAPTVGEYMLDRLPEARVNPWHPALPPLILTESNGMSLVLDRVAAEYACPIAGTKGQSAGFLRTVVAHRSSTVSGRMTVGQNEGGPADIFRVDLRCAGTTEDGLLMIGGHTVGAGGRFAGMPVGTFAAIALGRAPVEAAVWAGSGAWTPTTDCLANLDAWWNERRMNLRDDIEGTVEFGP